MGIEIERKFLVEAFDTTLAESCAKIIQGYVFSSNEKAVRVRIYNDKAYVTIKYRKSDVSRGEFEYEIPYQDALDLIDNACNNEVVEKIRYIYFYKGKKWEIDVFEGKNKGLILAEIELESEYEEFEIPEFIDDEVTNQKEYSNHNLAKK
ncbi:MAG: CYTH domain-containing protein [Ruminococcaceae bacterium]|nr:CYTH domain-containing protein [Oscillospiraceae bacterium]